MPAVSASKYRVEAGWDHVPHLDERMKREVLESTPPYLRDARTKGIPALGAGAIYPIDPEEILVEPFAPPAYWPRVYGLDVGWRVTAAVWGAWDRENDVVYLYSEHYQGEAVPVIHATAIKARGAWIPGVVDPAARNRSQADGVQLLTTYRGHGLNLTPADNAVEPGIQAVLERLQTGRLKVSRALQKWLAEYKQYQRDFKKDDRGNVVSAKVKKTNDHLMDAMRYLIVSGLAVAKTHPVQRQNTGHIAAADRTAGY